MFERRLKIILWTLGVLMAGLMARAGQIQIVQRRRWTSEAADILVAHKYIETTRGRILDCKGRVLAMDEPCMDACVAYPAVTEDWEQSAVWLRGQAEAAVLRHNGEFFKNAPVTQRKQMMADQEQTIRDQVHAMWKTLGDAGGITDDQMAIVRGQIVQRVEARRHAVAVRRFKMALARQSDPPWYWRWLPSPAAAVDDPDEYSINVQEESDAYVIVPAVSPEVYNELARNAENMPGLIFRPGRQRVYPYKESACHVIGSMSMVSAAQMKNDPNAKDILRAYWQNDAAGQDGVEKMCEQTLRGSRGEEEQESPDDPWQLVSDPAPGKDVVLSIDIELEQKMEAAFAKARAFTVSRGEGRTVAQFRKDQPGGAVVLDVATGRALALASYPNYDLNTLKTEYAKLRLDDLTQPLLDRTMGTAYEPGSTVKPLMGMAALADGIITPQSTIPCTGYLILGGHQYAVGRCWTMSEFQTTHMGTVDPLPSNNLTVVDAIERSCDVFFETVADRMKMQRQRYWYDRFGLGRPTGIGLPEVSGLIPDPEHLPAYGLVLSTCFAGIGQGHIQATPLQMANVAATLARGGKSLRPTLVEDGALPQVVDLGFSAEDVAAVKDGMEAVANRAGGTGPLPRVSGRDVLEGIRIAAKTGTAQASQLTVPVRDAGGQIVMENGREKRKLVDPEDPAVFTWYIAADDANTHYSHHWYIGYAPADHPRIAFAVFAEYGGSGSGTSNAIARDVLEACVAQGYLSGR